MGIREIAPKRDTLYDVDPRKIIIEDGWNGRFETPELLASIREVAEYVKKHGTMYGAIDPLQVYMRGEEIILVGGHRRLRGIMLAISEGADIKLVPTWPLDKKLFNEADRIAKIITGNEGVPLTPLEKAAILKRLLVMGVPKDEIAQKVNMSVQTVNNLLGLNGLAPEVQTLIKEGAVSATEAAKQTRKHKDQAPAKIREAVDKAQAEGKQKATKKHMEQEPVRKAHDPEKIKAMIGELDDKDFRNVYAYVDMTRQARGI